LRTFRIIPRLEIKSENLVKGMRMEGLKVIGDPAEFAFKYYKEGADEIIYEDIVATLYSRKFNLDCISRICKNIYIPATAGGGLKSENDINKCLNSGASKVSINTEFFKSPNFITRSVKRFGTQCICLQLQYQKIGKDYFCFHTSGRENTKITLRDAVLKGIDLGVGELHLISINKDGLQNGTDFDLLYKVRQYCEIPIIAGGGIGTINDIKKIIDIKLDGVAIGAALHHNKLNLKDIKNNLNKKFLNIR
tara:strand:+ start:585 stop:1334 length:750 start_codon:yes stop_codon:yes gene_type:complete